MYKKSDIIYFIDFLEDIKNQLEDMSKTVTELRIWVDSELNKKNFRVFGPDETMSNRLGTVFEKTNRRVIDHELNHPTYESLHMNQLRTLLLYNNQSNSHERT